MAHIHLSNINEKKREEDCMFLYLSQWVSVVDNAVILTFFFQLIRFHIGSNITDL